MVDVGGRRVPALNADFNHGLRTDGHLDDNSGPSRSRQSSVTPSFYGVRMTSTRCCSFPRFCRHCDGFVRFDTTAIPEIERSSILRDGDMTNDDLNACTVPLIAHSGSGDESFSCAQGTIVTIRKMARQRNM